MSEQKEGWVGTINGRKWHYVIGSNALCGTVIFGGTPELGNDDSSDNCSTCKKKLAKRKEKGGSS
jgi:hypothetical protein